MLNADIEHNDAGERTDPTLNRRQTLAAAAWTAPAILWAGSANAFASSALLNALRFTSAGAAPQYGSNWGTVGEIQFWYSMENVLASNPDGQSARITVTVTLKDGASATVLTAYPVAAGAPYSDNQFRWIVPGYTAGQLNSFYFTISAPGFVTVTSAEFTLLMP